MAFAKRAILHLLSKIEEIYTILIFVVLVNTIFLSVKCSAIIITLLTFFSYNEIST